MESEYHHEEAEEEEQEKIKVKLKPIKNVKTDKINTAEKQEKIASHKVALEWLSTIRNEILK